MAPIPTATLDARADFDAVTHKLVSTSLTGGIAAAAPASTSPGTAATIRSREQRTRPRPDCSSAWDPADAPWRLESQTAYDIHNTKLLEQRLAFRWRGSCWSTLVELRDYRIEPYKTRSYRIAIDLTGLGTFLDIHGGLDVVSPGEPPVAGGPRLV